MAHESVEMDLEVDIPLCLYDLVDDENLKVALIENDGFVIEVGDDDWAMDEDFEVDGWELLDLIMDLIEVE